MAGKLPQSRPFRVCASERNMTARRPPTHTHTLGQRPVRRCCTATALDGRCRLTGKTRACASSVGPTTTTTTSRQSTQAAGTAVRASTAAPTKRMILWRLHHVSECTPVQTCQLRLAGLPPCCVRCHRGLQCAAQARRRLCRQAAPLLLRRRPDAWHWARACGVRHTPRGQTHTLNQRQCVTVPAGPRHVCSWRAALMVGHHSRPKPTGSARTRACISDNGSSQLTVTHRFKFS